MSILEGRFLGWCLGHSIDAHPSQPVQHIGMGHENEGNPDSCIVSINIQTCVNCDRRVDCLSRPYAAQVAAESHISLITISAGLILV